MQDRGRRLRSIIFSTIVSIVSCVVGAYLIWNLHPLILPIALGILLAFLFRPLRGAFRYRWLPNSVRIVLLISFLTIGILGSFRFISNNIPNDKEKLEILVRMKYKFNEKFNKIMGIDPQTGNGNAFYNMIAKDINPLRTSLNSYLELSAEQKQAFFSYYDGVEGFEKVPEKYYKYFLQNSLLAKTPVVDASKPTQTSKKVSSEMGSFFKAVIEQLSIWFVMPIVFIFFLLDDGSISGFFIKLVPNRYFELALSIKDEVETAIGKYLRGISIECSLVSLAMALGLIALGFPSQMAILIGLLSGVATAIPLLGPIVGLTFGLSYALIAEDIQPLLPFITQDNLLPAVVVVNMAVLGLDNMVFQPIVLGGAVNLHPLVVILGLMAASMMFGMAGVLLAIPSIVVLKVVIEQTFRGLKAYRII